MSGQGAQIFKISRQDKVVRLTEVVSYKVPDSHISHFWRLGHYLPREQTSRFGNYRITRTDISPVHQICAVTLATFNSPFRCHLEFFNLKTPTRRISLTKVPWEGHGTSFSPAGPARLLLWQSRDAKKWSYAVWDLRTRKLLWQRHFVGPEIQAKWSRDGRNILISLIRKTIVTPHPSPNFPAHAHLSSIYPAHEPMEWLDARTGKTLRKIDTQRTQYAVDIVGNRIYIFGMEGDKRLDAGSVRIINPQNGRTEAKMHPSRIYGTRLKDSIAFSPNGQQIVFAKTLEPVRSWLVSDLKAKRHQYETWNDESEDEDY